MKKFVFVLLLSCGGLAIAGEPSPLDPQPFRLEAPPAQSHIWIVVPPSEIPTLLKLDPRGFSPVHLDAPGPGYRKLRPQLSAERPI